MSNFYCEKCGTEILEDDRGYYSTGCEHYPLEERRNIRMTPIEELLVFADGTYHTTRKQFTQVKKYD